MTDSEERARAFVATQEWLFAKTMADIPHYYCLKKKSLDSEEFDWFVRYMDAHSVPGEFYGKTYHYYYLDGWKYWIMDENLDAYNLINNELQHLKIL